jgi:UV DNA damage endonuclease
MLKSATPEKLRALIQQNLNDLEYILNHNLEHNWMLFRIGSSVIPFGSHPVNQVKWWQEFKDQLKHIGSFARVYNMRLSFHPGQYTVLNSPDPQIVSRAIDELAYSARFLDELGLDEANKIVIHLGGVYGDKTAAMKRFIDTVSNLHKSIRSRLVIENDERNYAPSDALTISAQTGLPVVFDNLHYAANPDIGELEEILKQVFGSWQEVDGLPKVHFSSQAEGGRTGNHAEQANPVEFREWLTRWSAIGKFDLMLEAKGKDQALQALMEKGKI